MGRSVAVAALSFSMLATGASSACLPEAIPDHLLKNVTDQGVTGPLGLWLFDWQNADLATAVFSILAREVLGYRTTITGLGQSSISGMYATSGCEAPNEYVVDPKCGRLRSPTHIAIEAWLGTYEIEMRAFLASHPSIASEIVGEIGYGGFESQFVMNDVFSDALSSEGLPLEYYKSYNTSWHDTWKYFDRVWSIPVSNLKPCSSTRLFVDGDIRRYVQFVGDQEGITVDQNGKMAAKCWNSSWWLSPACRNTPETCIPTITGGDGWYVDVLMQMAAAYQMPIALAVSANYGLYETLPRRHRLMIYWWNPDATFIDLAPKPITFPPFSASAWAKGDKRTQGSQQKIVKFAYRLLSSIAPFAYSVLSSMQFEPSDINALLLDMKVTGDKSDVVACRWLHKSRSTWLNWIPSATKCLKGFGLVNLNKDYVRQRAGAVGCDWCPPGRASQELSDDQGRTYVCAPCEPGTSQPKGAATSCNVCEVGTAATTRGSTSCKPCEVGTFQGLSGSADCAPCPALTTTLSAGALSADACVCPAGSYRSCYDTSGVLRPECRCLAETYRPWTALVANCLPCPVGLHCEGGSDEANVPCPGTDAGSSATAGPFPKALPGYFTDVAAPLSVYLCLEKEACPGSHPGRCSSELTGIACGICKRGYFSRRGQCYACGDSAKSNFVFPALPALLAPPVIWVMYRFSQDPVEKWGSAMNSMVCTGYLTLVYIQVISTITICFYLLPQLLGRSWAPASYTTEFLSIFSADCADFADFKTIFILRLLLPVWAALAFLVTYAISVLFRQPMARDVLLQCYGSVFYTFFVGIAAQTFSLFQCYEHPNGEWSVRSAPQVLQSSDLWKNLVGISVTAIVVFCAGSLALFCYAVMVAPTYFKDLGFRTRWKFLLQKFRPTVHWWGLVMLVKGIWLSLTTVMFSKGVDQSQWLAGGNLLYFLGSSSLIPWRSFAVASLDVGLNGLLMYLFVILPHFVYPGEVDLEAEAKAAAGVAFLALGFCAVTFLVLAKERVQPRAAEHYAELAESLCSTFSQLTDRRALREILTQLPTADVLVLGYARDVFRCELLVQGPQRRTFRLSSTALSVAVVQGSGAEENALQVDAEQVNAAVASDLIVKEPDVVPVPVPNVLPANVEDLCWKATPSDDDWSADFEQKQEMGRRRGPPHRLGSIGA